jgi:glycosyltransferase EpsF
MEHIKPIRILHVVGAMNRGGTETMLMNIYRHIDHEHVQFDFISYSQEEAHYDREIEEMGGQIIRLTKTTSIKQIYNVIKENGPYAAIHAHTLFHCGFTSIAARLAGVKIRVSHAHTTSDHSESYLRKFYISSMRKVIQIFSTHLLACSKEAGNYLFGRKNVIKPTYSYFPNVIDYERFLTTSQIEMKKFKVEEGLGNHLVLGHIGTFKEVKNHLFILEVMKKIVETLSFKLILVGDGELKKPIQREVEKSGLVENVHLLGVREDIATILSSMDVFVFPSLSEGLGLVLLEAQASGVPCIVSEAIQPEADLNIGLITQLTLTDGPQVWADKIIELASHKEQDVNKIINGFERNGYSIKRGISKLMHIYQTYSGGENEADTNFIL